MKDFDHVKINSVKQLYLIIAELMDTLKKIMEIILNFCFYS